MNQQEQGTSLAGLVDRGHRLLAQAGVSTPLNDARLLLADALGCDLHQLDQSLLLNRTVEELLTNEDKDNRRQVDGFQSAALERYQSYLQRRAGREPLQYILGHAYFRYLDLRLGPGVFIPRPETETVVQAGVDALTRVDHPLAVDLCSGSGAIGLSLATEVPGARVRAVEVDEQAYRWGTLNAAAQEATIREAGSDYQLLLADATDPATLSDLNAQVDLVISNPPYVPMDAIPSQPEVRDWDPDLALYGGSPDGCLLPCRILDKAMVLLIPGGLLVMEHDVSQGPAMIAAALERGYVQARTHQDPTGRDRYLTARRPG
ncbi:peptide chain release factor N(5)-glutamine methyltransferase [Bifidobacterium asteroides]|uniref:peptide chain release factor N(5)-glutamine methyltransferase n=1 Tax=Bifidobacterium asteroides TaxID=1684 RepID=UPI0020C4E189|nr:peptide chain release factor N(5)-glutamine methyltransferase [Bifidobacterium asteroides]